MRLLLMLSLVALGACYDENAGILPIVGIWEMDTSRTQYLAAEPRASEMFRCSAAGDNVRCAIVSERHDGMIYNAEFDAKVGGPRAPVRGFADVQEVQLSYKDEPVLDATFYNRNRPAYSWRARRSTNGDTLVITRIDMTSEGPRSSEVRYNRVRPSAP